MKANFKKLRLCGLFFLGAGILYVIWPSEDREQDSDAEMASSVAETSSSEGGLKRDSSVEDPQKFRSGDRVKLEDVLPKGTVVVPPSGISENWKISTKDGVEISAASVTHSVESVIVSAPFRMVTKSGVMKCDDVNGRIYIDREGGTVRMTGGAMSFEQVAKNE